MPLVPRNGSVAVIGSGISGLSFAYVIHKLRPDVKLTIFDNKKGSGGWIQTTTIPSNYGDIRFEKGARTLRGASDGTLVMLDILNQIGAKDHIRKLDRNSDANRKYLMNPEGKIIALPHSVNTIFGFVNSGLQRGIFKGMVTEMFKKPWRSLEDESIGQFFRRRFGSLLIAENVFSAVLKGIYAGDINKLSVNSLFPRLKQWENDHGSIIRGMIKTLRAPKPQTNLSSDIIKYNQKMNTDLGSIKEEFKSAAMLSLDQGLAQYTKLLAQYLALKQQVSFKYGTKIEAIDQGKVLYDGKTVPFDHIHSTLNLKALSSLVNPTTKHLLDQIQYVTIAMANVYSPRKAIIPPGIKGFGFLVPDASTIPEYLIGTIFDSDIQEAFCGHEVEYNNVTLMFGGYHYSTIPSDELLKKAIKNTLGKLGVKGNIRFHQSQERVTLAPDDVLVNYSVHKDCIPQYNVGYEELKQKILLEVDGKFLVGGMCFLGVGVPHCVMGGALKAIEVAEVD